MKSATEAFQQRERKAIMALASIAQPRLAACRQPTVFASDRPGIAKCDPQVGEEPGLIRAAKRADTFRILEALARARHVETNIGDAPFAECNADIERRIV